MAVRLLEQETDAFDLLTQSGPKAGFAPDRGPMALEADDHARIPEY
jgi:hypothetical protein